MRKEADMTIEQIREDVGFVKSLYESKDMRGLKEAINTYEPIDIVHILEELSPDKRVIVYRFLQKDLAHEVFEQLDPEVQEQLLNSFSEIQAAQIIEEMEADDRVRLLDELPARVAKHLVATLSPEEREKTALLRGYEHETAGRVMTPEYVAFRMYMSVTEALEKIRHSNIEHENLGTFYVIDADRILVGIVTLQELVMARPDQSVGDIMDDDFVYAVTDHDQEVVARMLQEYDLTALPVVDRERRLVGAITIDDVIDIIEEETTEDFHKIGAVGKFRINFREAGVPFLFRMRIRWLLVLVFMNVFSGAGIAYFEDTIEAVVALVFFLPLLIDSGGNAGSQSATMMVRALATGDVVFRDWFKLLWKEVRVAILMGVVMALGVALIATFRAPEVMIVVAATMTLVVVVGSLIGMSLPFALSRFNMDPAAASGPLVTSLADIAGVLIYFSIATWYLGVV
jgi:magnesium transporter